MYLHAPQSRWAIKDLNQPQRLQRASSNIKTILISKQRSREREKGTNLLSCKLIQDGRSPIFLRNHISTHLTLTFVRVPPYIKRMTLILLFVLLK